MILVIDNYDSFVHNLARHMELAGWAYYIARNDKITLKQISLLNPEAIIISPGPCAPQQAGVCIDAVRRFGAHIPILGVCLGHQCIGEAYGAQTIPSEKPTHGKASMIHHDGDVLFAGIPNPFKAGRYHSLAIGSSPELNVTAQTTEGEIMAIQHKTAPVFGVQFHPESVLTEHGMDLITNFTKLALMWNNKNRLAA